MKRVIAMSLLLFACGGGDDPPDNCTALEGATSYLAHYEERPNGTCGALPDQVIVPNAPMDDSCVVTSQAAAADGCSTDLSATCAGPIDVTLHLEVANADGTELTGVATVVGSCSSTYNVTYTAL